MKKIYEMQPNLIRYLKNFISFTPSQDSLE